MHFQPLSELAIIRLMNKVKNHTLIWTCLVLASGFAGMVAIFVFFDEPLDTSNPEIHESPNNLRGWSIASLSMLLPFLYAAYYGTKKLKYISFAVLLIQFPVWLWALAA